MGASRKQPKRPSLLRQHSKQDKSECGLLQNAVLDVFLVSKEFILIILSSMIYVIIKRTIEKGHLIKRLAYSAPQFHTVYTFPAGQANNLP